MSKRSVLNHKSRAQLENVCAYNKRMTDKYSKRAEAAERKLRDWKEACVQAKCTEANILNVAGQQALENILDAMGVQRVERMTLAQLNEFVRVNEPHL